MGWRDVDEEELRFIRDEQARRGHRPPPIAPIYWLLALILIVVVGGPRLIEALAARWGA